ncbi:MAG: DUF1697 domain-containing protein [Myxococcota bacterium]|jgi:uncharacterized protein (DUF1697 family)|nr:DUF1697 domain-containing protein [Myxococcota bacterium]
MRYAALLRGVSPMNCSMPALKKCLEKAGFSNVVTVLSSGNVVFDARSASIATLEKKVEAAIAADMKRAFPTLVRSIDDLAALLESEPYRGVRLSPGSKRVITFLRRPPKPAPKLPIELDGAKIVSLEGTEVFSAYVTGPKGPVFMTLLEKTFGKDITTRTWDTVTKLTKK